MPKQPDTYTYRIPQPLPQAPSPADLETPEKRAHTRLVNAVAGKVWMLNALPDTVLMQIERMITDGYTMTQGSKAGRR